MTTPKDGVLARPPMADHTDQQKGPHTITLTTEGDRYKATLTGVGFFDLGRTRVEAMGKLLYTAGEQLGITIHDQTVEAAPFSPCDNCRTGVCWERRTCLHPVPRG